MKNPDSTNPIPENTSTDKKSVDKWLQNNRNYFTRRQKAFTKFLCKLLPKDPESIKQLLKIDEVCITLFTR